MMAFADVLIHTCTIQRATTSENAYGGKSSSYGNYLVGVACRLESLSDKVLDTAQAAHPTVTDYRLMLPAGTDVTDEDRITDVQLNNEPSTLGTFTIEAIRPIPDGEGEHHLELGLSKVGKK
jgi:hypothetical protein